MPVEQAQLAGPSGPRRSLGLADIAPQYVAKSGLQGSCEVESPRGGSVRIRHMTGGSVTSHSGGPSGQDVARFPLLNECAHFHYDHVDLPGVQTCLYSDERRPPVDDGFSVQVTSHGLSWLVRRSYDNFLLLDKNLHGCVFDRRFSRLPELPAEKPAQEQTLSLVSEYLCTFSSLPLTLLNCGPVLNWLEMDNRGRRLLASDDAAINTPAVAAAYATRGYAAQAVDEISFQMGDMISVIDMPPSSESIWWRGKLGFSVGFFPGACVSLIGDKLPRSLRLPSPRLSQSREPSKPVLRRHGKLIAFFRSFILARPSRRRLKQSGILKERVFGCDLGEHLLDSGHDVPMVLKCCSEFIETHGLVDGIYRLSGVTSNIQKLRNAFDADKVPALYDDSAILQDIHSVASLLKMYFRELPNPLCTYQLYETFVGAAQTEPRGRLAAMREAVRKLPPTHYRTLRYLMSHLARVAAQGNTTGMTARNIAIVWAPNLLRCKELEVGGVAALQGVGIQAVVTEFLICYSDLIFCDKMPDLATLPPMVVSHKKSRPKSLAISTPARLLSLEEARSRALSRSDAEYIEVGGGPSALPGKYHTVIDLPRKRRASKRSPLGWRSLFKSTRKHVRQEVTNTQNECLDSQLRSVKSAESLQESPPHGAAPGAPQAGVRPTHSRSTSHDSYFETLDAVHTRSRCDDVTSSSLDLSEIQLNFDLEEREMRMFSEEDEDTPRLNPRHASKAARVYQEETSAESTPKKQAKLSRHGHKRSRLEDRLSADAQGLRFIDSQSPDNTVVVEAEVHPSTPSTPSSPPPQYRPLVEGGSETTASTPLSPPDNFPYDAMRESSATPTPSSLLDATLESPSPDETFRYDSSLDYENVRFSEEATRGQHWTSDVTHDSDRSYENVQREDRRSLEGKDGEPGYEDVEEKRENRGEEGKEESLMLKDDGTSYDIDEGSAVYENVDRGEGRRPCYENVSPVACKITIRYGKVSSPEKAAAVPVYQNLPSECGGAEASSPDISSSDVYEQVKYLRHSISQVNQLTQPDQHEENRLTKPDQENRMSKPDQENRFTKPDHENRFSQLDKDNQCTVGDLVDIEDPTTGDLAREILEALDLRRSSQEKPASDDRSDRTETEGDLLDTEVQAFMNSVRCSDLVPYTDLDSVKCSEGMQYTDLDSVQYNNVTKYDGVKTSELGEYTDLDEVTHFDSVKCREVTQYTDLDGDDRSELGQYTDLGSVKCNELGQFIGLDGVTEDSSDLINVDHYTDLGSVECSDSVQVDRLRAVDSLKCRDLMNVGDCTDLDVEMKKSISDLSVKSPKDLLCTSITESQPNCLTPELTTGLFDATTSLEEEVQTGDRPVKSVEVERLVFEQVFTFDEKPVSAVDSLLESPCLVPEAILSKPKLVEKELLGSASIDEKDVKSKSELVNSTSGLDEIKSIRTGLEKSETKSTLVKPESTQDKLELHSTESDKTDSTLDSKKSEKKPNKLESTFPEPELKAESTSVETESTCAESVRRRIESDIGRDIIRDRRMRQELELIRSTGIRELVSRFQDASPTKERSPPWSEAGIQFSTAFTNRAPKSPAKHANVNKSELRSPTSKLPTKLDLKSPEKLIKAGERSPTKDSRSSNEFESRISPSKEETFELRSPTRLKRAEHVDKSSVRSPKKEEKTSGRISSKYSSKRELSPVKSIRSDLSPKSTSSKSTVESVDKYSYRKNETYYRSPHKKANISSSEAKLSDDDLKSRQPRSDDSKVKTYESKTLPLRDDSFSRRASKREEVFKVTLASGDFQASLPADRFYGSLERNRSEKPVPDSPDEIQRRARIEKYKEERRNFLREKYKSCEPEKQFRIRNLSKSPDKCKSEPITCVTVKEKTSPDKMDVRITGRRSSDEAKASQSIKDMAAIFESKHYMSSV